MTDLHYLALSAVLAWAMLMVASLLSSRGWSLSGMLVAFGNRDALPPLSPVAGRAERAARNMLENLLLFTALVAAVRLGGKPASADAAALFFWSRVLFFGAYLGGIRYLRTAVWLVSVVALARIAAQVFAAPDTRSL